MEQETLKTDPTSEDFETGSNHETTSSTTSEESSNHNRANLSNSASNLNLKFLSPTFFRRNSRENENDSFYGFSDSQIKGALLNFGMNVLGLLILATLWANYILLTPYFASFFWAVMISIPLHSFKKYIVNEIQLILQSDSSFLLLANLLKLPFEVRPF